MFSSASQLRMLTRNKFRASGRASAEDELGNKIRRPPGGFTHRHAETEKIFGVHLPILPKLGLSRDGLLRKFFERRPS